MPTEPGPGRVRLGGKLSIATALFVLVVSVLPLGLASASPVPSAPLSAPATVHAPHSVASSPSLPSSASGSGSPLPAQPHPLGNSGTIVYYGNTTGFATVPANHLGCTVYAGTTYQDNYCYPSAVNPTLVNLPNGNIGIGYEYNTNATGTACTAYAGQARSAVGFSVSSNGGASFGSPAVIVNQTCRYLDAIEPSFAVSGSTLYGAFVEENTSVSGGIFYGQGGATRDDSALAFTSSANSGTSFSTPVTIVKGGNITRPQIATFGNSIYIAYVNMSTSATTVSAGGPFCYGFCYPSVPPAAVDFVYSTDAGATWHGPVTLPGLNASLNDFAINPAVAVNATGTIAVSYFTNGNCTQNTLYGCMDWGLDLVVATSTSNGSTWSGPYTVTPMVGISTEYFEYFDAEVAYWVPQSQILFDPTGQTIDITYSGLYNKSYGGNYYTDDWCCAGIFFATGSVTGSSFTVTPIYTSYNSNFYDDMFNPAIGLNGGTLYVDWTWNNETYCYQQCDYVTGTLNERLVTSTDGGATWSDPLLIALSKGSGGCTSACAYDSSAGYQSSIAFNGSTPLLAYTLPGQETSVSNYWGGVSYFNVSYPTRLYVSEPYVGPTVVLNLTENNLLPGTVWSFTVQGLTYSTNSTSFLITNIPQGRAVTVRPDNLAASFGERISPTSSVGGVVSLSANATVYFNYSLQFELIFFEMPLITPYMEVYFVYNGTQSYFYSDWYCYTGSCYSFREWCDPTYTCSDGVPEGWWYPQGAVIQVSPYAYSNLQNSYWNGTGLGSYTGTASVFNITMDSPINETGWAGQFGVFNESVNAVGLPSTSTYSFTVDGSSYSAGASDTTILTNVISGPHSFTDISATSSTVGWEYFGTPNPSNPVVVPAEPIVNLTFAYVDVGASVGTISFHATGLTMGTSWHFSFNGTEYSSTTPWINVTEHPGTYATQAYPVVAANGSVGYAPVGVPSTWSVTTGSTYSVNYSAAFQTVVTASTGGTISGTGHGTLWLAGGTAATFHAVASNGYEFGGWTGTGLNAYSGSDSWANFTVAGPTTESASFYPLPQNRYNLTFQESGLAAGTWWSVFLSGQGYSTDQPVLQVQNLYPCGPLGNYNLSIPYAYVNGSELTRYAPGGYHATVCTSGSTLVSVQFSPQYYLSLGGTAGGIAQAAIGANTYSNSLWVDNGTSVLLAVVPAANYKFLGWNGTGAGSYTGSTASVGIVMTNPITEIAAFAIPYHPPPPTYWVDFHLATPLAPGTAWTVHLGSTGYSASGTDLNITGLNATSSVSLLVSTTYTPDGLTRYTPVGAPTTLSVSHNQTVTLSYSTSYWVSVTANYGGTIVAPSSNPGGSWVAAGLTITINATANDGYVFLGWTGSGAGSYTGDASVNSIAVKGPIHEVAAFAIAPPASTTVTSSSIWSAPTTWIGLAVVGLLVGLVVGLLVGRRGGGQRPAVSEAAWSEEPGMAESPAEPMNEPSSGETGGT
jgi:Divergent InlB B-repeat domain